MCKMPGAKKKKKKLPQNHTPCVKKDSKIKYGSGSHGKERTKASNKKRLGEDPELVEALAGIKRTSSEAK